MTVREYEATCALATARVHPDRGIVEDTTVVGGGGMLTTSSTLHYTMHQVARERGQLCENGGAGFGDLIDSGIGRTDTARLAAFSFRAPVYGGPDGRPARACRFGLRRARSSTPISGCRPTWKLVGSRHQARLEANHG